MSDETGTAVGIVAPPDPGGEGSAPSQTETPPQGGGAGAEVEATEAGKSAGGLPQWAYKNTREIRELKRSLRAMEERFAQGRDGQSDRSPTTQDTPKDIWTDPEGVVDLKVSAALDKREFAQSQKEAWKIIRSQQGISPDDEDEIADLMEKDGLIQWAKTHPKEAAQVAIQRWREQKGITENASPESSNLNRIKSQAKSVVGAVAPGGQKIWSLAEVKRISENPDEYAKNRDELLRAQKEGRIR